MKRHMMNVKTIFVAAAIAACLLYPPPPILTAAEYTVGGGGSGSNYYATLEQLRASGRLQNNDIIILNGDDNTLTAPLVTTNINITLQGTGKISTSDPSIKFKTGGNTTINSHSLEFNNFESRSHGGAIYGGWDSNTTTITGGTNMFSGNSTTNNGYGGAIYTRVAISDGTNTFSDNSAYNGGAIGGPSLIISGGTNTFSGNVASSVGGAIYGTSETTTISGGTNTFSGNSAGGGGGAIFAYNLNMTGGTNTFINNSTKHNAYFAGGAIHVRSDATLRATDGDFTFRGNKDNVGTANEKANAIYMEGSYNNQRTLTLAAQEDRNIFFYDPITSNSGTSYQIIININSAPTDTGRIIFDGSDYADHSASRHSAVYGTTTVGNGTLALKGNVIYGAAHDIGTFFLNDTATLLADETTNRIQANSIMLYGTVDVAAGGVLELKARGDVFFNGALNIGLGFDEFGAETFGSLLGFGDYFFGTNAVLNIYWDDTLFAPEDGWSYNYRFFSAGSLSGLENLNITMNGFNEYAGFTYSMNSNTGILSLSYTAVEVPEPATLLMLGLAAVGLPVVRRLRKG